MATALAGALKFDGIFTVQAQGNGPVSLLIADVTSSGNLRGYARFDAEAVAKAGDANTIEALMGKGHLAFTVDQGSDTDRYQGIVELVGPTLADSARLYFQQSEQLDTDVHLACAMGNDGQWRAACLMLSRMPAASSGAPILIASENDENWSRATILLSTLTDAELLDETLSPEKLLWRLFHQEQLIVQDTKPLQAQCRCSRPRIASTLRSFPRGEIEDLADENGLVIITCEFCQTSYSFNDQDLVAVYEP
jgi:molecular chaperone Hsp33